MLEIVVILPAALLVLPCAQRYGLPVRRGVVVYGYAVDVVHGADEIVDPRVGGEGEDVAFEFGSDELCFEANEDVDLRAVEGSETEGLDEVGFVAGD